MNCTNLLLWILIIVPIFGKDIFRPMISDSPELEDKQALSFFKKLRK